MKRSGLVVFSLFVLVVMIAFPEQQKPQIKDVDGIRTVQNPKAPAKGTIVLEVEKLLEINPFDNPDVDLKWINSARMDDGRTILFDVNRSKAYLFSPQGALLKNIVRNGQGPGEFSESQIMYAYPMKDKIYITSRTKLAKFNDQGTFIEELRNDDSGMVFIDEASYVTETRGRRDTNFQTPSKIVLKRIKDNASVVESAVFKEGSFLLFIQNPSGNGGFGDDLCIPGLEYAYDPKFQRIYVVEKSGCTIEAFDLSGKKLFVSEASFDPYKISRSEVEKMFEPMVKSSPRSKWIIDAYPKELMTTFKLTSLPNGYLAVYRIIGPRKYEIEIFDKDGVWQYALKLPEGMTLMNENFYSFGFSNIEMKDDFPIYVEYRIKNLPEIFK